MVTTPKTIGEAGSAAPQALSRPAALPVLRGGGLDGRGAGRDDRSMPAALAEIEAALRAHGLDLRGAFHPTAGDRVPPLRDGRAAGTVVLAGNLGASMWAAFERERRDEPDPLDCWTERALRAIAERFAAGLVLAHEGPPFAPIQRWALRAEPVHRSPIALLIHPQYGLWHAYRGALLFAETLPLAARAQAPSPCESCAERPCLSTCPVGAFTPSGYDAVRCAAHVSSQDGVECHERGCLARRACPVAREHAYRPAQQRFHMRGFLGLPGG
jgi:hypothetical protein